MPQVIRDYFGDGDELGVRMQYAVEQSPAGTAGTVKNAEEELRDDTFIVISGDALTDVDLHAVVDFHKKSGAMVTIALKRVDNPLEFGVVVVTRRGASSASSRSPRGARSSPTPSTPASTWWSPLSSTTSHPPASSTSRPSCSPS